MKSKSPFISLSEVKPRKVDWFWKPYIPYGMITIMEGDPGQGKSYLSMHLASLISTGGLLPDGTRVTQGYVHYISSEDDASYTIRPRIDAMGGDPEYVRVLNADLAFDKEGLKTLRAELDEHEPEVIFIDPWVSFVPPETKLKDSNAVRSLIREIGQVAEDYNCAIVLIRHLTKMKHENALYQGGGTIDLIAAARSAIRVAAHPQDEDLRVMAHLKHNVGPRGVSRTYRLAQETEDSLPVVEFVGETDLSVDDLSGGGDHKKPKDTAEEFLKRELADGPRPAAELIDLARKVGISERTLARAKKNLGVQGKQRKSGWWWSLVKS